MLFTAYQAVTARAALKDAAADLHRVRDAVAAGDLPAAQGALAQAQESTGTARDNTDGPVWWLAGKLPVLGDDVGAVRTVADVSDGLTHAVLPGLVDASASLSPADLQPTDGRIDIDAIERVAPQVVAADRELGIRVEQVAAIDTGGLIGQVAGPVTDLRDTMTEVQSVTDAAARAVQLLPPMLGAEGPRTYLMLFQNNAETRATGGIPGAVAVVSARDGRISLGRQGTAQDLGIFAQPVLPLTQDEASLFTPKVAQFAQNVNFTPDFPRTAQLAREMWQRSSGQTVDGVISTDPVGLSYLLEGTGPVGVPGGQQLTADNAVDVLLNDVYMNVADQEQQNAFFAVAARNVFDAVTSGRGDPRALLEGVSHVARDDRLLLWSAHQREQALLSGTAIAGALPRVPTEQPAVGVYFNDGTGAKMGYYLDYDVRVDSLSCDADARQRMRTTVVMRSTAPPDAASLPESVIGPGFGARPGTIRMNVLVYAPLGGAVQSLRFNGQPLDFASLDHDGRPVGTLTVDTAPGEEHELVFEMTGGPGQPGTADLRVTPGAQPHEDDGSVGASTCG
ncbi:MAG: DUF4012 domain-containing protein [Actinomycetota bacterium]|nr:DUF4012 domain-containing protein [Actinomycetota bacterium]